MGMGPDRHHGMNGQKSHAERRDPQSTAGCVTPGKDHQQANPRDRTLIVRELGGAGVGGKPLLNEYGFSMEVV